MLDNQSVYYKGNFNSIKVRLERLACKNIVLKLIFQFHKGTIRTCVAQLEP